MYLVSNLSGFQYAPKINKTGVAASGHHLSQGSQEFRESQECQECHVSQECQECQECQERLRTLYVFAT